MPRLREHDKAAAHADDPVRRRRLRHAAVRAGERALGDAGADEFHQPRARRLRHGRRLCDGAADEPRRRRRSSPPCRPPSSSRRSSASSLERTLYRRLYGASPLDQVLFTIGLVLMAMPIADFFLGDEPQQVNLPAWLSGSVDVPRRRHQPSIACSSSSSAASSPRPCSSFWSGRASARSCGRRSTTRASPTGSASTSTASSPSPSPSAAGSRASAARSRPTSSAASTRRFRSSSW